MMKNFFLISNLNLPSFSLEPFPLVLSLHTLVKIALHPSCSLPGAFSSPGWTATALLACPRRGGTAALWSSLWPSSGPAPTHPCPSYVRGPRAGCSTPGGVQFSCLLKAFSSKPLVYWFDLFLIKEHRRRLTEVFISLETPPKTSGNDNTLLTISVLPVHQLLSPWAEDHSVQKKDCW